ncbi:MAG: YtoQ family protein [Guyparkeria sp.]|uniref:YtoQ family protein n=1 Tax=Guyparkeria sp. TaxID=2035736 RepID=UPI00397ABD2A
MDIEFTRPVTDHAASDAAGDLLGEEDKQFWRDHKSAKVNAIRIKTLIEQADVVVVRFGDQYKQWNAGYCAAMGTPYITLHDENIVHPLKEVDAAAMAWATTPEQVVGILEHVLRDRTKRKPRTRRGNQGVREQKSPNELSKIA